MVLPFSLFVLCTSKSHLLPCPDLTVLVLFAAFSGQLCWLTAHNNENLKSITAGFGKDPVWSLTRHRNGKRPEPSQEQRDTVGLSQLLWEQQSQPWPAAEGQAPSSSPSLTRAKAHQEKGRGKCLNEQLEAIYSLVYGNVFLRTFKDN